MVILEFKIYVYNFQNLKMIEVMETASNLKGLCAICPSKDVCVMANPDKKIGAVKITNFDKNNKTVTINAHQSALSALALNNDGSVLATSSDKVFSFS